MDALEMILLALVLVCAGAILTARHIRTAVGMYILLSLLLAILWGLHYGGRVAMTELGVGVVMPGLLFWFTVRTIKEKKGPKDESKS